MSQAIRKAHGPAPVSDFNWQDPLDLESQLSEDERMIRDSARAFAQDKLQPRVQEAFRKEHFHREIMNELGEMGFLGVMTAEAYGGSGLGYVAYGLVAREIERVDSGYRSAMSVQNSLVMHPIEAYGSEAQRKKYLPKLATAELIGCFGLTEPDAGSDPGGMKMRAQKVQGGYLLNGSKMWITNSPIADLAVIWAKTEDNEIRGFVVERGTKGFSTREQKRKHSLRASVTSELVLQDVHLPASAMLPLAQGLGGPLSCLTQARYGIAWGVVGSAMAVYDEVRTYGATRVQFGKPIAGFQLYQAKLATMLTEITKAQLMNLRLGRLKDAGKMTPQQVSMAKRNACHWALEIARIGRDMLGANGITDEYQTMRHMCNLESVKTYEGTHDIHTLILGHAITGLDAFR